MRIAIADDDEDARAFLISVLQSVGHRCLEYASGTALANALKRDTFDLLILDWNMPGLTGLEILAWVRDNLETSPSMIVMTSRTDKSDIVAALEAGADDYIMKPESAAVIAARVASVIRRSGVGKEAERFDQRGRYHFDRLSLVVKFEGKEAVLTAKEFQLAQLFFDNLQRPLSRSYIMQRVWNNVADLSTRTLDMHVSRLRTKLDLRPENGYNLQTVFGYGYRLDTYDEAQASDE